MGGKLDPGLAGFTSNSVSFNVSELGNPTCSGVSGFILSERTTLPPHSGKFLGVTSY